MLEFGNPAQPFICMDQLNGGESCGLAVEHLAHDRKVVGSIPVQSNARGK